jgi:hypothetical protein
VLTGTVKNSTDSVDKVSSSDPKTCGVLRRVLRRPLVPMCPVVLYGVLRRYAASCGASCGLTLVPMCPVLLYGVLRRVLWSPYVSCGLIWCPAASRGVLRVLRRPAASCGASCGVLRRPAASCGFQADQSCAWSLPVDIQPRCEIFVNFICKKSIFIVLCCVFIDF